MTKRIRLEVAAPGPVNTAGQENYYTETEVDDDVADNLEENRLGHAEVVKGRKPSAESLMENVAKATIVRDSDEPNSDKREADRSRAPGQKGTKKVSTDSPDNAEESEKSSRKKSSDRKESERGTRTAETTSRRASERR